MKYSPLFIFMVLAVSACSDIFPTPAAPTMTPSPEPSAIPTVSIPTLWISPAVPEMLKNVMKVPDQYNLAGSSDTADYIADVSGNMDPGSKWIYALTVLLNYNRYGRGGKVIFFLTNPF
jgi:hypothetical protein